MRAAFQAFAATLLLLLHWGCSSGANDSNIQDGKHGADWTLKHGAAFFANEAKCIPCHGSTTKADKGGGTSKVSCFAANFQGVACHAAGPKHPAEWAKGPMHGRKGAMGEGPAYGFDSCRVCHGKYMNNKKMKSCYASGCHIYNGKKMPHPNSPWYSKKAGQSNHAYTAESNLKYCRDCHKNGANSSKKPKTPSKNPTPGCWNSTLCHDSGHAKPDPKDPNSKPFGDAKKHGPPAHANLASCIPCHTTDSEIPRLNLKVGAMKNGCEDCHPKYSAHPVPWLPGKGQTKTVDGKVATNRTSHAGAANLVASCTPCHGEEGKGGLIPNAISCMGNSKSGVSCHHSNPIAKSNGCVSCHGNGPDGDKKAAFPNRAGAHPAHDASKLPGVTCDACHRYLGYGKETHANGKVEVNFDPRYVLKGKTAVYESGKCSNISCHGGKLTKSWTSGEKAGNCFACHEQKLAGKEAPYNAFKSPHEAHMATAGLPVGSKNPKLGCAVCHDMALLRKTHFTTLQTQKLEGENYKNIRGKMKDKDFTYKAGTCSFTSAGSADACHSAPIKW